MHPSSIFIFAFLFYTTIAYPDDYFVIRNPHSGLVLDAYDGAVRIRHYTGSTSQLWKLQATNRGTFFLINVRTERVLDVNNRNNMKGAGIIVTPKSTNICQSWHVNSDQTIANACGDFALDVARERFSPGSQIISWPRHSRFNQKFGFQFVNRRSLEVSKQ